MRIPIFPEPELYSILNCGAKSREGDVGIGIDSAAVPVNLLAQKDSPIPWIASPPLGKETWVAEILVLSDEVPDLLLMWIAISDRCAVKVTK